MSLLIEPELLITDPFKMVPINHKQMFRDYFKIKFNITQLFKKSIKIGEYEKISVNKILI